MDKTLILRLDGWFVKSILLACIVLTLTKCGVAYQSSKVLDDGSGNIRVVRLTPETVLEANRSPYTPQRLPAIFSNIDKVDGQVNGHSSTQRTVHYPAHQSGVIETRLPTPSQPQPYAIGISDVVVLSTPEAGSVVEAPKGLQASQNRRRKYTVQDDGAVSIPEIGRIVIGALTLQEAEDAITQQLVEAGAAPLFSIEVAEFNSQRVSVLGAVVSPGIEPLALQPLYLDQAISRRGGIAINDASFVVIRLHRNGSMYQISVTELYNQDNLLKILLRDGDRVVVEMTDEYNNLLGLRQQVNAKALIDINNDMSARVNAAKSVQSQLEYGAIAREYVYIIGEVEAQSRFTLPFENTAVLADALLESGGISSLSGSPKQIYVLRGPSNTTNLSSITALHLDATNAANFLLATRLELRPGDVVFVGTQPITNWNRVVGQMIPSLVLANAAITAAP
ncbi:MAG: sugar transporter [Tateyamaria sp.]|nr:sugar transporter [Tateyamaria sp.]